MHLWRALSTCLANMQSNVILLVLPGLHSEKIECELKKSAQPQLFAMAHLQFSQNSFFQKNDIMHYWRALSMGLANKQSKVILLFLLGLHSEKIECELKKVPNPNFLPWLNSNFLKFHFFKKLILGVIGKLQARALRLVNQKIYSGFPQGFILPD